MNPRNTREPDREDFTFMISFHPLLKDATKDIRKAGRRILPKTMLKVSGIGEKITLSNLTPPDQPNTCTIAIFNR